MLRASVGRLFAVRTLNNVTKCKPLVVTGCFFVCCKILCDHKYALNLVVRNRADTAVSDVKRHGMPSVMIPGLTETDESFDAKWIEFFNSPQLDEFELKQGVNDLYALYDAVPEPDVVAAALKAARRLNNFALAIRIIEAVKKKGGGDMNIYNYIIENIRPTLDQLGINTLEELGFHKVSMLLRHFVSSSVILGILEVIHTPAS